MGKWPDVYIIVIIIKKVLLNQICQVIDEYRMFLYSFFMEVLFITKERENPINEQIRVKEMMVIGPNGEQLGVKSKQDALFSLYWFDVELMQDLIQYL